jgi:hypothetical protein
MQAVATNASNKNATLRTIDLVLCMVDLFFPLAVMDFVFSILFKSYIYVIDRFERNKRMKSLIISAFLVVVLLCHQSLAQDLFTTRCNSGAPLLIKYNRTGISTLPYLVQLTNTLYSQADLYFVCAKNGLELYDYSTFTSVCQLTTTSTKCVTQKGATIEVLSVYDLGGNTIWDHVDQSQNSGTSPTSQTGLVRRIISNLL